jgi:hypothetical protein
MADTSTDVALSTCATALQEADEVLLVLEIKSEFFLPYDEETVYTSCEVNLYDKGFLESHNQLCDVYQALNINDDDPTRALSWLRNFVYSKGGLLFAYRLDIEVDQLDGIPFNVLTVWTSKAAYDKWHLANDRIIHRCGSDGVVSRNLKGVGCIDSHRNIEKRVQSVALAIGQKNEDNYTVFKFEIPFSDRVMPQMKSTISYRDSYRFQESEYCFPTVDHDKDTEFCILYVFPPLNKIVHPNLKKFKTEPK